MTFAACREHERTVAKVRRRCRCILVSDKDAIQLGSATLDQAASVAAGRGKTRLLKKSRDRNADIQFRNWNLDARQTFR